MPNKATERRVSGPYRVRLYNRGMVEHELDISVEQAEFIANKIHSFAVSNFVRD